MIFGGGDPGFSGAVAWLDEGSRIVGLRDMPVTTFTIGAKERRQVDARALQAGVRQLFGDAEGRVSIWIEAVNSYGMGRQSAFNFGGGWWRLITVMEFEAIRFELVHPARWKKLVGLLRASKDASVIKARQLWPGAPLTLGKDGCTKANASGRAEALLIAEAHRRAALGVSA